METKPYKATMESFSKENYEWLGDYKEADLNADKEEIKRQLAKRAGEMVEEYLLNHDNFIVHEYDEEWIEKSKKVHEQYFGKFPWDIPKELGQYFADIHEPCMTIGFKVMMCSTESFKRRCIDTNS